MSDNADFLESMNAARKSVAQPLNSWEASSAPTIFFTSGIGTDAQDYDGASCRTGKWRPYAVLPKPRDWVARIIGLVALVAALLSFALGRGPIKAMDVKPERQEPGK